MELKQVISRSGILKQIQAIEGIFSWFIILGTLVFAIDSGRYFIMVDWFDPATFGEFINRALLIVIGLELARMLRVHSLVSVLELLAFVIARKLLVPELSMTETVLGVLGFCVLVLVRLKLFPHGKQDRGDMGLDCD